MNIDTSTAGTLSSTGASALLGVGGTASEQQDRFLKLLITQLKNQDPLNPIDNAQMTTQIAQMSSLQGIEKLNATLDALAASMTGGQAVQTASLIGHSVMAPGSDLQLAGGRAVAGVELAQAADRVQVVISDASGVVVHRADLGPQPAGTVQLEWDGIADGGAPAQEGRYRFGVTATANGKDVGASTLMVATVRGVSAGKQGTTLDLGAMGTVGLAQVKRFQ